MDGDVVYFALRKREGKLNMHSLFRRLKVTGAACILFTVLIFGLFSITSFADINNKNVRYLIELKDYGYVDDFYEGFARFQRQEGPSLSEGYIDITGRIAIICEWPQNFSEGLAAMVKDGKKGYIDRTGRIVIEPRYDFAKNFNEGLAAIQDGEKWGYIDRSGKQIVSPVYDYAGDFYDGMAIVGLSSEGDPSYPFYKFKLGVINNKGEEVVKPKYDVIQKYSENLALVMKDEKFGYIDKTGREVIKLKYSGASSFNNGTAVVCTEDGKSVLIDHTGKVVGSAKYIQSRPFREGMSAVEENGKWGYINEEGKEVVKPVYDYADDFYEGLAKVEKEGKQSFINKKGEEVIKLNYDKAGNFNEGLARVEKEGKWGYIDKSGREVIAPFYDYAYDFKNGMAKVYIDGKTGYIANPMDLPDTLFGDEVEEAINRKLVPRYMQYGYNKNITRRDFTALIISLIEMESGMDIDTFLDKRNIYTETNPFIDINDNETEILAANKLGIVQGNGNCKFCPDTEITRQEAAVMLERAAEIFVKEMNVSGGIEYADKDMVKDWAISGVNFVSSNSLMPGPEERWFNPIGKYTRQEAIASILRLFKLID